MWNLEWPYLDLKKNQVSEGRVYLHVDVTVVDIKIKIFINLKSLYHHWTLKKYVVAFGRFKPLLLLLSCRSKLGLFRLWLLQGLKQIYIYIFFFFQRGVTLT